MIDRAFILAAGHGRRMEELTHRRPKPLVALHSIPLLHYTLYFLYSLGVRDVALNLFVFAEQIEGHLEQIDPGLKKIGLRIKTVREDYLLGTGGGLANLLDTFPSPTSRPFYLINCDLLIGLPPAQIPAWQRMITGFDLHQHSGLLSLLPARSGQTGLDLCGAPPAYLHGFWREIEGETKTGPASGLVEFYGSHFNYIGFSVWKNDIHQMLPPERPSELKPLWMEMAKHDKLAGLYWPGLYVTVGTKTEFLEAERTLERVEYHPFREAVTQFHNQLMSC